jgi:AsmA protein
LPETGGELHYVTMPLKFLASRRASRDGTPQRRGRVAWAAVGVVLACLVVLTLVFDWNWLRAPLQARLAVATGRSATIETVDGEWHHGPRLVLRGITLDDEPPSGKPLFKAREMTFDISITPLLRGELHLSEVGLSNAIINLHRDRSGEPNWSRRPGEPKPERDQEPVWKRLHIGALTLNDVVLTVLDEENNIELRARADSPPEAAQTRWPTRIDLTGHYGKSRFRGQIMTGTFITLTDTGTPFPIKGRVEVERTLVEADGVVADLLGNMSIDSRLTIAGPTLSSLYPTLRLALPSSPPYRLQGHLRLKDDVYNFDEIVGKIGRSDIGGHAQFDMRPKKPKLTATLASEQFALVDLGAAIGVPQEAPSRERIFPDAEFDVPRLNAMDAQVSLKARRLIVHPAVPFENLSMRIEVADGVMRLQPLQFGLSGGDIVATIVLDARRKPISADAAIDFRKIDFSRLFPTLDNERLSAGELGAQVRLNGRGQSVAELLGSANGTIAAAMDGGRISHAVVAAASLDGGKLLPLLLRGDKPVALRCAAVSLTVQQGMAWTEVFVLDTETVRIDASGALDMGAERLGFEVNAQPKEASILSLRGPLHIEGTFRHPRIAISAATLLRGGAAIALGVVNPLAALLPLIETGPGQDTNCAQTLQPVEGAVRQSQKSSTQAPAVAPRRQSRSSGK